MPYTCCMACAWYAWWMCGIWVCMVFDSRGRACGRERERVQGQRCNYASEYVEACIHKPVFDSVVCVLHNTNNVRATPHHTCTPPRTT
jgi:hypothetical protein